VDKDYKNIKIIGFDADDTLWINETYFYEAKVSIMGLLSHYASPAKIDQELVRMELQNLSTYGYGIKGFILSMVEMAITVSKSRVSNKIIDKIIQIGKQMHHQPIELLENVERVLTLLSKKYKLILATKGDLLDQQRKLKKSGLRHYFQHIEILSDKKEENYKQLLEHLNLNPQHFLMIGNSLKSDVLPPTQINAQAIHIPFPITWNHEKVKEPKKSDKKYKTLTNLEATLELLI